MEVYVVKPNDSIETIALQYNVSVAKIIQYNELVNSNDLVTGQTIVITHPEETYIVRDKDKLEDIAKENGISLMQLLRNNPFLADRKYIYPGETLIIRYKTKGDLVINGYAYPFIPTSTLIKTLPFLTYISVNNYRLMEGGKIATNYDDTEIIQTSLYYGTIPLMMTSILSPTGETNVELAYNLLMNEEYQDRQIDNIISITKTKGFYGVNMVFSFINSYNIELYNVYVTKAATRVKKEGLLFFVTINPYHEVGEKVFKEIDYSTIGQLADSISFTHFLFGRNMDAPGPVSSFADLEQFMKYIVNLITPTKIRIGTPVFGYDWTLPYVEGSSIANAVSVNEAINLARINRSTIQFDEKSRNPYFKYIDSHEVIEIEHEVWFTDARTVNSILDLISYYALSGKGVWNIMIFYAQMWLMINSEYNIVKLIPDKLEDNTE